MESKSVLRPMGVGEILDAAIHLYRENFALLIMAQLPAALLFVIISVITRGSTVSFLDIVNPLAQTHEPLIGMGYLALISLVHGILIAPIIMGAVIRIPSEIITAQKSTVKKAYSFAFRNFSVLVVTNFLITVAIGILAAVVITIPAIIILYSYMSMVMTPGPMGVGVIAGFIVGTIILIAGVIVILFIWTRWIATFPILVAEEGEHGSIDAIRRSWELVKGRTLQTFGVILVVSLIPLIIQYSPLALEYLLFKKLPWVTILFGTLSQTLLIPLVYVTEVIVYYELRTRKEGFDLEQRVKELET